MEKRAAFAVNKYYGDAGMDYVYEKLRLALGKRGVTLTRERGLYAAMPPTRPPYDFAVFWDKDAALARNLQAAGLPVYNGARTIEVCDDKEQTFAALSGRVPMPPTVFAPLVYDVNDGEDEAFLDRIETLAYPVVVKACVGSQGRQVYKATDRETLAALHRKLMHTPHLFQKFVVGTEEGTDTRVYIVGKRAVGCVRRRNTVDFRSNTACGGQMCLADLPEDLRAAAEEVARVLSLDYGSADFMDEDGAYVFIEANSSPYMQRAEALGIPLSELYAAYLTETVYGR